MAMEKKRLQLDFSDSAYQELEEMQDRLNAPSKSEVIRNALGILRWVVDEVDKDHRILVEKPEGTREIVFHFITRAPAKKAAAG
jgi:metal-responsive CopG/Arc/MetJ family transcriptional regulator